MTTPPEEPDFEGAFDLGEDFDFDAEFEKAFGSGAAAPEQAAPDGGAPAASSTRPRALVAVVLTPISSAPALAGLCQMAGIEAAVVPTSTGALAVRVIERDENDDLAELLGQAPEIATSMAATLSRTNRYGATLLVSRLGEGDEGLVGTIAASRWLGGERSEEKVSSGLVLAQTDDIVEQLLFGATAPADAAGVIEPGKLPPFQARRLFRKTQRKPRP